MPGVESDSVFEMKVAQYENILDRSMFPHICSCIIEDSSSFSSFLGEVLGPCTENPLFFGSLRDFEIIKQKRVVDRFSSKSIYIIIKEDMPSIESSNGSVVSTTSFFDSLVRQFLLGVPLVSLEDVQCFLSPNQSSCKLSSTLSLPLGYSSHSFVRPDISLPTISSLQFVGSSLVYQSIMSNNNINSFKYNHDVAHLSTSIVSLSEVEVSRISVPHLERCIPDCFDCSSLHSLSVASSKTKKSDLYCSGSSSVSSVHPSNSSNSYASSNSPENVVHSYSVCMNDSPVASYVSPVPLSTYPQCPRTSFSDESSSVDDHALFSYHGFCPSPFTPPMHGYSPYHRIHRSSNDVVDNHHHDDDDDDNCGSEDLFSTPQVLAHSDSSCVLGVSNGSHSLNVCHSPLSGSGSVSFLSPSALSPIATVPVESSHIEDRHESITLAPFYESEVNSFCFSNPVIRSNLDDDRDDDHDVDDIFQQPQNMNIEIPLVYPARDGKEEADDESVMLSSQGYSTHTSISGSLETGLQHPLHQRQPSHSLHSHANPRRPHHRRRHHRQQPLSISNHNSSISKGRLQQHSHSRRHPHHAPSSPFLSGSSCVRSRQYPSSSPYHRLARSLSATPIERLMHSGGISSVSAESMDLPSFYPKSYSRHASVTTECDDHSPCMSSLVEESICQSASKTLLVKVLSSSSSTSSSSTTVKPNDAEERSSTSVIVTDPRERDEQQNQKKKVNQSSSRRRSRSIVRTNIRSSCSGSRTSRSRTKKDKDNSMHNTNGSRSRSNGRNRMINKRRDSCSSNMAMDQSVDVVSPSTSPSNMGNSYRGNDRLMSDPEAAEERGSVLDDNATYLSNVEKYFNQMKLDQFSVKVARDSKCTKSMTVHDSNHVNMDNNSHFNNCTIARTVPNDNQQSTNRSMDNEWDPNVLYDESSPFAHHHHHQLTQSSQKQRSSESIWNTILSDCASLRQIESGNSYSLNEDSLLMDIGSMGDDPTVPGFLSPGGVAGGVAGEVGTCQEDIQNNSTYCELRNSSSSSIPIPMVTRRSKRELVVRSGSRHSHSMKDGDRIERSRRSSYNGSSLHQTSSCDAFVMDEVSRVSTLEASDDYSGLNTLPKSNCSNHNNLQAGRRSRRTHNRSIKRGDTQGVTNSIALEMRSISKPCNNGIRYSNSSADIDEDILPLLLKAGVDVKMIGNSSSQLNSPFVTVTMDDLEAAASSSADGEENSPSPGIDSFDGFSRPFQLDCLSESDMEDNVDSCIIANASREGTLHALISTSFPGISQLSDVHDSSMEEVEEEEFTVKPPYPRSLHSSDHNCSADKSSDNHHSLSLPLRADRSSPSFLSSSRSSLSMDMNRITRRKPSSSTASPPQPQPSSSTSSTLYFSTFDGSSTIDVGACLAQSSVQSSLVLNANVCSSQNNSAVHYPTVTFGDLLGHSPNSNCSNSHNGNNSCNNGNNNNNSNSTSKYMARRQRSRHHRNSRSPVNDRGGCRLNDNGSLKSLRLSPLRSGSPLDRSPTPQCRMRLKSRSRLYTKQVDMSKRYATWNSRIHGVRSSLNDSLLHYASSTLHNQPHSHSPYVKDHSAVVSNMICDPVDFSIHNSGSSPLHGDDDSSNAALSSCHTSIHSERSIPMFSRMIFNDSDECSHTMSVTPFSSEVTTNVSPVVMCPSVSCFNTVDEPIVFATKELQENPNPTAPSVTYAISRSVSTVSSKRSRSSSLISIIGHDNERDDVIGLYGGEYDGLNGGFKRDSFAAYSPSHSIICHLTPQPLLDANVSQPSEDSISFHGKGSSSSNDDVVKDAVPSSSDNNPTHGNDITFLSSMDVAMDNHEYVITSSNHGVFSDSELFDDEDEEEEEIGDDDDDEEDDMGVGTSNDEDDEQIVFPICPLEVRASKYVVSPLFLPPQAPLALYKESMPPQPKNMFLSRLELMDPSTRDMSDTSPASISAADHALSMDYSNTQSPTLSEAPKMYSTLPAYLSLPFSKNDEYHIHHHSSSSPSASSSCQQPPLGISNGNSLPSKVYLHHLHLHDDDLRGDDDLHGDDDHHGHKGVEGEESEVVECPRQTTDDSKCNGTISPIPVSKRKATDFVRTPIPPHDMFIGSWCDSESDNVKSTFGTQLSTHAVNLNPHSSVMNTAITSSSTTGSISIHDFCWSVEEKTGTSIEVFENPMTVPNAIPSSSVLDIHSSSSSSLSLTSCACCLNEREKNMDESSSGSNNRLNSPFISSNTNSLFHNLSLGLSLGIASTMSHVQQACPLSPIQVRCCESHSSFHDDCSSSSILEHRRE